MKTHEVFTSKAGKYARYRWRYAPAALHAIFEQTGIGLQSTVADIGAGTGILTREFIGKVGQVYAVEPNPEMRAFAEREFAGCLSCQVIAGRAEATSLKCQSVDLITAAQAMHWFEPALTRKEFRRIAKPGCWLAMCRNTGTDEVLGEALAAIFPPELDTEDLMVGKQQPRSFYFLDGAYTQREFPFQNQLSWEAFIGSLETASNAPVEGSPAYPKFESAARRIFKHFSRGGVITIEAMTVLYVGQVNR